MYLLIVILNNEKHFEDLLQAYVEVGISDATVLESQSINDTVGSQVPIFAGLKYSMGDSKPYSKTILSIIIDKQQVDYLVKILDDAGIDINEPGSIRIMTLKLDNVYGKPKEFDLE
ncbi:TPA: hypothetical protein DCW38_03900 [candidate division WOR-3 bacterium]|jgi:hypothetical protein|uniref:P-II family nitrogen regulator n=1 Tax=candidate division WOR-3 bacterium TaxID=2052148 RepID=A0A350H9T9_UNCW3|nr:hypothetical protein [candidate division WOR-3 bacterium]